MSAPVREVGDAAQVSSRPATPQTAQVFVVVPAYNEAENLPRMLTEVGQTLAAYEVAFQFLVVNDGSQDATAEVVEGLAKTWPIRLLHHPKNRGVGAVFLTGLTEACAQAQPNDAIIILEADGTNDPRVIPQMLERIRAGDDVVIGSRYRAGGGYHKFPLRRLILSRGANWLMKLFFPIANVRDYTIFCRAYRAGLLQHAFERYGDRLIERQTFACNAEILVKLHALGLRASEAPMHYRYDLKRGRSKLAIQRTIKEYLALMVAIRRVAWRKRRVRSTGRQEASLPAFLRRFATPRIIVGIVMVAMVWLGAQGMTSDLPHTHMGPEQRHVQMAVKYSGGDFNPHAFDHPTLLSYVLFVLYGVAYLCGLAAGWFHSAADFERLYFTDPTLFYVIARVLTLIAGVASAPLFYLIGKRLYGIRPALIATFGMALAPVMVIWMHFATPTIPVFFMFVASLYFVVKVFQGGGVYDSVLAGLLGGLAVATKYDAGLIIFPLMAAHLLAPGSSSTRSGMWKRAGIAFLALAAGFFIGCPFAILDRTFINNVYYHLYQDVITTKRSSSVYVATKAGWPAVVFHMWPAGWGGLFTVLALIGVTYALARRRREDLLLLSFIPIALVFISSWKFVTPRYFLLIMPFMLLLGARWLAALVQRIQRPRAQTSLLCVATGVLVAVPLWQSLTFDRLVSKKPVYHEAKDWIESTIPAGSVIVSAPVVPLAPNADSIHRELKHIEQLGLGDGIRLRHLLTYVDEFPITYDLRKLPWPWRDDYDATDYDLTKQIAAGGQYFIITQDLEEYAKVPMGFKTQLAFYHQIKQRCEFLKEFRGPETGVDGPKDVRESYLQVYRCR